MSPITQIKPTFASGELSPSIWGRTDLQAWHAGATVMRNMFVSYKGPASSRAGTAYVLRSLTPVTLGSSGPRLITFQFSITQAYVLEFGVNASGAPYMRVIADGGMITEAAVSVTALTLADPCVITAPNHGYSNNDWVFGAGFEGTTQLNGVTFIVQGATQNTFSLYALSGVAYSTVGAPAYTGGGTFSRIFTDFSSPYALEDLPYLKVVQSADVMTLCCVNTVTGTEYPPIDLERLAANNWNFDQTTFAATIGAPTNCAATASETGSSPYTQYSYCVTAVDATTGDESIASNVANITQSVDLATTAGSHTITWTPVAGAAYYNVYQAPPAYDTAVPVGSVFGYIGTAYGNNFVNTNITADLSTTPPLHLNPFGPSQITGIGTITQSGNFVQATTTLTINSATGSGGVLIPVVRTSPETVVAVIIQDPGEGYLATDTVTFTDSSNGGTGTAPLQVGPSTGTYPGSNAYFQSRRVYASTLNNPDTEYFSQSGAYTNMDARQPPIDSDAIVLTPWGQQVDGIQFMLPMPGGLISATGLDAWQVSGANGAGTTLTPTSESAQPQESNGFSPTVPPLKINYDILYVQSLGSVIRDLQYNFFTNIYAGTDISLLSNHLFDGYQVVQWAWAKVPWKIVWTVRSDGKFLSLTFDKEENLKGWARHDTNGLVVAVATATEPPVDATYFVVQRYIPGQGQWAYYIERMDNRLWSGPEDPWCIDAGLALAMPEPNATLSAAAAEGPGTITGGYLATGGQNYSAPSAQINDPAGTGSGGQITFTVAGGVITGFTIDAAGANYSPGTTVQIVDQTGAGATFVPQISQNVLFTASAPVFSNANVDNVIRIGGGQAIVSTVNSPTQCLAAITVPIVETIPNDPNNLPAPAASGDWTMTPPVTTITGLDHLDGFIVTGLADGAVIPPTTVANGSITLAQAASNIKIGLPFVVQFQPMPIEVSQLGSVQGDRKRITGATYRVQASRGFQGFANQPIASALDFQQEIAWTNGVDMPQPPSVNMPPAALPLFTGDIFVPINDDWQNWDGYSPSMGLCGAQQSQPLPFNLLAVVPKVLLGDNKDQG